MISPQDGLKLKKFVNDLINTPRAMNEQFYQKLNGFLWCEDWEIMELCKCIFNGENTYRAEASPRRLKNNPLFSKDEIVERAKELVKQYKTADALIVYFSEKRKKRDANTGDGLGRLYGIVDSGRTD